jgi:hypothetical protein
MGVVEALNFNSEIVKNLGGLVDHNVFFNKHSQNE